MLVGEMAGGLSKLVGVNSGATKQAVGYGIASVGVIGVGWKAWQHIEEGHVALRTRFKRGRQLNDSILPWGPQAGEIYRVVEPGPHIGVPGAHNYLRVSVMDRTREEPHAVVAKDVTGAYFNLQANFTWGVIPKRDKNGQEINHETKYGIPYNELVFRALYKANSLNELTYQVETNICIRGLCSVLNNLEMENVRQPANQIMVQDQLVALTQDDLLEYGCDLRSLSLSNIIELKNVNRRYMVFEDEPQQPSTAA